MNVPIQTGALALAAGQSQSPQDGELGWLDGGDGDDRLTGDAGADILLGGAGGDLILDCDDVLYGGARAGYKRKISRRRTAIGDSGKLFSNHRSIPEGRAR